VSENLLKPINRGTFPAVSPEPVPPEPPYVTGGPPFPPFPTDEARYGISILDYFAAHIIAGLAQRASSSIDDLKVNGAKDAYWIAAMMVNLRNQLPVEPTLPAGDLPIEEQTFMIESPHGDRVVVTGWEAKKLRDTVKLGGSVTPNVLPSVKPHVETPETQETGSA